MRESKSIKELEDRLACLNADLYQTCGSMSVTSLERLCRRIHLIEIKIYSFRVSNNGKKQ